MQKREMELRMFESLKKSYKFRSMILINILIILLPLQVGALLRTFNGDIVYTIKGLAMLKILTIAIQILLVIFVIYNSLITFFMLKLKTNTVITVVLISINVINLLLLFSIFKGEYINLFF